MHCALKRDRRRPAGWHQRGFQAGISDEFVPRSLLAAGPMWQLLSGGIENAGDRWGYLHCTCANLRPVHAVSLAAALVRGDNDWH